MIRLRVVGMTCSACSTRVERALRSVPGVESVRVCLLTNSAIIGGETSINALVDALRQAGYDGFDETSGTRPTREQSEDRRASIRNVGNLILSFCVLGVLFYFSTCVGALGAPLWKRLNNPVSSGAIQLLLSFVVVLLNRRFFIDGLKSFRRLAPNMDALVALGSGASFLYSVGVLFSVLDAFSSRDFVRAYELGRGYYFESSAAILVFISVGKALEACAKGKTTDALRALEKLIPKLATVEREGVETKVEIEQIRVGDVFVLRAGERTPVDGRVVEGVGSVDESALTGESAPVDKKTGDAVKAGTTNASGFLRCEATRVGDDTALAQIIRLTNDAASSKAPVARLADKIAAVFVPTILALALITAVVWLCVGRSIDFALVRAVAVLVVSCPCALGLATPAAIMVGMGVGARRGILFKTAEALEIVGKASIIALDKTGVVTSGRPRVVELQASPGVEERELLEIASALESKSEHPLARAVVEFAQNKNISSRRVENFQTLPGAGVSATVDGEFSLAGKNALIVDNYELSDGLKDASNRWETEGKTVLFFARGGRVLGALATLDVPKEGAKNAISDLRRLGLRVVMITGDAWRVAKSIGTRVGIGEICADVDPAGKERKVVKLREKGIVAFVGDGINDAPALTRADVGIAVGARTDVAIDASDVALMNDELQNVATSVRLSRATLRNIRENLFWAFFYNVIGITLAAGLWEPLCGWTLSPTFAALAMSLSSFCVVTNALRLNFTRLDQRDARLKKERTMKKTIHIEGMMCGHCEARVKKALEALPFVASAQVDHKKGTAALELNDHASGNLDATLKESIEAQDYRVLRIE